MKILTDSRLKVARRCQREHEIRFELGFEGLIEAAALKFGRLIHLALEAWWLGWQLSSADRLLVALQALDTEDIDPFDRVKAQELIRGYHYRWIDEDYEVLAVEVAFETALINPATAQSSKTWRLAGKIDVVVRDRRTGLVHIIEHKTTSEDISPGSSYFNRLRIDGQVSIYYLGAASLGYEVAGCVYDVIHKPRIKPLKATPLEDRKYRKDGQLYANQREEDETPEEYRARLQEDIAQNPADYYQRADVVRLDSELLEAMQDNWILARQLRESANAGIAPRNPDACMRYGRECEFFAVCTGQTSLEDGTRYTRKSSIHPELPSSEDTGVAP